MKASEAIAALIGERTDEIAVCALGMAAGEWWTQTSDDGDLYIHGAMGFSASIALGLAIALPQATIWAINSDGSLCMNPGCLITEAGQRQSNLKHFVLDNQVYETVGSVPMVAGGQANYAAMAQAVGFASARTVDTVEGIAAAMPEVRAANGPTLTVLRVEPEPGHRRHEAMDYEGPEVKYRFGRNIERRFGVRVFGPQGY